MALKRGLGGGFDKLIPTDRVDEIFDLTKEEDAKVSELRELEIEQIIQDPDQPRKTFEEEALQELSASIKEHGILQPLVVTPKDGKYMIVAGERRWRAAGLAGLEKVPAIVRKLDDQNRLELSIIENAQRADLSPIELATAYAKLKAQFNLSDEDIAKRVGKSVSGVKNTMRLLSLPESAKIAMQKHRLTEGVMRPLVNQDKDLIEKALPKIIEEGWSARKAEQFIAQNKKKSSINIVKNHSKVIKEADLEAKYNCNVYIRGHTIVFTANNDVELEELRQRLLGEP